MTTIFITRVAETVVIGYSADGQKIHHRHVAEYSDGRKRIMYSTDDVTPDGILEGAFFSFPPNVESVFFPAITYPEGEWQCAACGQHWDLSQLHTHPSYTNARTCCNLFCGGTCIPVNVS